MKPSIKTITVKKTLWVTFAFLITVLIIVGYNFQRLINETMRDKGFSIAMAVEATLTSHMRDTSFEMKEELINTARGIPGVNDLLVVRHPGISEQFGLADQPEITADTEIAATFSDGEARVRLPGMFERPALMRITYPYKATVKYGQNCITCHAAEPGDVLAVIGFDLDTTEYQWMSLTYLYVLLGLFLLALLIVGRMLFWVLDKTVSDPLRWLIDQTKESYEQHVRINTDRIEAMELDYFATKVNEFNRLVLQRNQELHVLNEEIQATQREVIHTMGSIGETRSKETANHVIRVAEISLLLARKVGLSEAECDEIHDAAPMHDIGKVGIPDSVLNKPGRLTEDEYKLMKTHSQLGHEIFEYSERPLLKAVSIIAQQHHERWDGNGYPLGLAGDDIHIYGRIVAVADVFDALISPRCYKAPWPAQRVYEYFQNSAGTQFDPTVVAALTDNFDQALAIVKRYAG